MDKKAPLNKIQKEALLKKRGKIISIVLQALVVVLVVGLAVFSDILFPDTEFADIIDRTLGKFFDLGSLVTQNYLRFLETFAILLFMWILQRAFIVVTTLFVSKKIRSGTGILLLKSFYNYFVLFLGLFFILTAWGVDSLTLLASVGLIGFVVSFGAQGLIEDILAGLFLILEKQFSVGDIIIIDGFRGVVTEIGLRTTKFLDIGNQDLKIINNKDVRNVINASINLSTAVCDVGIAYEEDLEKVEKLIAEDFIPTVKKKYAELIGDGPNYAGVTGLADSSVNLKFVAKCKEEDRFKLGRLMNREFKLFCDRNKIDIPFPQVTINQKAK
jgi:moderate conductance mechanosensitive channel